MEKYWEMPKEFGEKWIATLRSGKYEQSHSALKDNKGYCCLGVACAMVGIEDEKLDSLELIVNIDEGIDLSGIPDILIQDIDDNNLVEILTEFNDGISLIKLNSIRVQYSNLKFRKELELEESKTKVYFSFEEIADFIEDNIEMI